jgi:hypothetical protein
VVVSGLAGVRHRFIELGHPGPVLLVGQVLDLLTESMKLIVSCEPTKTVADEAKHRLCALRFDTGNHHAREQPMLDRE